MQEYDVALWRFWPSLFPEWTETVRDFSPQSAMYTLMRLHGLRFVEKVAVRCGTSPIQRYYDVICPRLVEVSSHD
jgi:hypothetical protein